MRKRNVQILFRLTEEEAEQLNELVRKSGRSKEAFLRETVKGYRLCEKPDPEFYKMMRELSAIGNRINQLAVKANALGFIDINQELRQYSPELADRPQIVVANKTDLLADPAQLDAFRAHVEEAGYAFMAMSAATHQGTRELVQAIAARLAELPPVAVYEPEYVPRPPQIDTSEPLNIQQEDNTWLVEGPWLQRLMANINFSDYESRMYFDKMLRQSGLFDQLERMGIQDGDIVSMYNLEFEYQR